MVKRFSKTDWLLIAAIFLVAALVRAWPEIKGGYWPIGYDTLNTYVPDILKFDGNFSRWILSANLLYFIMWPIYKIFHLDPNLIVKIVGPLLYGSLASSFYWFCRRFLNWERGFSFLAAFLIIFQLPTLRLSWDLLRNVLGLIFLFPALYYLQGKPVDSNSSEMTIETLPKTKNLVLFIIFSMLLILSNQLVSSMWLVIVIVVALKYLAEKEYPAFIKIILAALPAILLFIIITKSAGANTFGNHVIYESESNRIFNYVDVYKNKVQFQDLSAIILSIFWLCYQFTLPFAIYGFWKFSKNIIIFTMTAWLLVGTFSSLIFGGYGIFVWDRWLLMLVFPFTIFAVTTFREINIFLTNKYHLRHNHVLKTVGVGLIALYVGWIAVYNWPFISARYDEAKKPFLDEKINSYFPSTMIHNAVGYKNLPSVLACIDYINRKAPENSVIMIDNRYRGLMLTKFDYSNRFIYSYPWSNEVSEKTIDELRNKNAGPIFTIWYTQKEIDGFQRVFYSGLVAVYRDKETYRYFLQNL